MAFNVKDANLIKTVALPTAAGAVAIASLDVKSAGDFLADAELLIEAPALDGTMLPATRTMTYSIWDSANDSSYAQIADAVIVQTGASSVGGAAAATARFRLPTSVRRYVKVYATGGSSIGNCAAVSLTVSLCF